MEDKHKAESSLPLTREVSKILDFARRERNEAVKEYNRANIPIARLLRKNMTPWERKLWYDFLRSYPIRFQRQKAIGEYIADFYCAKARLIVELDGSQHYCESGLARDKIRTEKIESRNLNVIRVPNNEVNNNFNGVCEYIDFCVKKAIGEE